MPLRDGCYSFIPRNLSYTSTRLRSRLREAEEPTVRARQGRGRDAKVMDVDGDDTIRWSSCTLLTVRLNHTLVIASKTPWILSNMPLFHN